MFNDNENIKPWKTEFHLKGTHKTYWLQIIDTLQKSWKNIKKIGMQTNSLFLTSTLQKNLKFVVLTNLLVKSYI